MRQIAGGSQSGLRKFFQQYPSLFTIEGEMVCITQAGTGKGQVKTIKRYKNIINTYQNIIYRHQKIITRHKTH